MTGAAALGAVSVNALGSWLHDDVPLAPLVSVSVLMAFVFGLVQAMATWPLSRSDRPIREPCHVLTGQVRQRL